jgi:hypothetical protein
VGGSRFSILAPFAASIQRISYSPAENTHRFERMDETLEMSAAWFGTGRRYCGLVPSRDASVKKYGGALLRYGCLFVRR